MRQFKFFNGFIDDDFIHLESVNVEGGVRRLRAMWNPEPIQEIESYHNIDAERELSDILANEILNEIDNEIVRRLTYHVEGRVTEDPSIYLNHWLRIGENRA